MRLKNRKKSAAAIKSMKVGTDELKELHGKDVFGDDVEVEAVLSL